MLAPARRFGWHGRYADTGRRERISPVRHFATGLVPLLWQIVHRSCPRGRHCTCLPSRKLYAVVINANCEVHTPCMTLKCAGSQAWTNNDQSRQSQAGCCRQCNANAGLQIIAAALNLLGFVGIAIARESQRYSDDATHLASCGGLVAVANDVLQILFVQSTSFHQLHNIDAGHSKLTEALYKRSCARHGHHIHTCPAIGSFHFGPLVQAESAPGRAAGVDNYAVQLESGRCGRHEGRACRDWLEGHICCPFLHRFPCSKAGTQLSSRACFLTFR